MDDGDILAAAHVLRPRVSDLAGEAAVQIGPQLDDLLTRAGAGEVVVEQVLTLLTSNPATRQAFADLLPAEVDSARSAYPGGLPGFPSGSDPLMFVCGSCGYLYPVFELGERVPDCPNGHGALQAVG